MGDRIGGRLACNRSGLAASFLLGTVFAVGWTPCTGPILGGILGLATQPEHGRRERLPAHRLHARPGLPFLALAAFYDRAQPADFRPWSATAEP